MFDYVNFECVCPVCKSNVSGFQTKDSDCLLETVEPSAVRHFYSSCSKCGCWINFYAKPVTNFTMTVTSRKGKKRTVLHEHTKDVRI
jgi:hypothetical protein